MPRPSGFRFYHTHVVAGGDLNRGTYTGQAGPVYIEPQNNPGAYDREVFLVMKEFAPALSRGGDMAMDALAGAPIEGLQQRGQAADEEAKEKTKGFEVGYELFAINGRMLGHGEPDPREAGRTRAVPCAQCECDRNPQPRSARPVFSIVALDGNQVPTQAEVPRSVAGHRGARFRDGRAWIILAYGSWAISPMTTAGTGWGLSSNTLARRARRNGSSRSRFAGTTPGLAKRQSGPLYRTETIEITIVKHNAALDGFNQWTLNGEAFSMQTMKPRYSVRKGAPLPTEISQRQ